MSGYDKLQGKAFVGMQSVVQMKASVVPIYILILNWNGWVHTIECLESVFRLDYRDYRVIVCDNASEDGSLEHIKAWAEGRLDIAVPKDSPLRHLSFPPVTKPIRYAEYDRRQGEIGGDRSADPPLALIQTGGNLGFAGGNNVGLRYALARDDFDYVWLLNNDTVVRPGALRKMVERMASKPDAGVCGATLLYYDDPDKVQALGGGTYSKWFGVAKHIGQSSQSTRHADTHLVERRMDYVVGASMLVSNPFIQDIGIMCEDYFLYCEDTDWSMRARGRYGLAYAPEAVVYHKEGGAAGSNFNPAKKSLVADYYGVRSRLILTRRLFPWALPTVYLGLLGAILNRIRRRRWSMLAPLMKLLVCTQPDPRCTYGCKSSLKETR